ncbi:DNA topoisomerase IB [Microbacterium bovistercoris]|uniref:DNA topoisomerase n=1 Tax=Microbacterium bovistercoris TaxID=2293570 RepID=A0A371NWN2_9MICO|nr:DNA topoisomerase IB [Microbacterium bovistercoris]REJ06319.1 DNA topoisomerase IB [Microbacterium bovistercoris]
MRLRRVSPDEPGLRRVRRGNGFEYRDAGGAHIDDEQQRARIRALAIPPAWADVWICTAPNGHLQATGVDDAGRTQYLYHPEWRARADAEKFDRMLLLAQALPAARRGVTRDLRTEGTGRRAVIAAAFRMLDAALLRIGSEQYAREHGSIGLSTLRCAHATVSGDVVSLRFPGKSGQPWESEIADADLAALVRELRRRRTPASRLLAWEEDGSWHPLRAAEINDDVRARTGGDFTAKDFRTLHATVIAASSIARAGTRGSRSARSRVIAQAVRDVAAALGNTPAVARGSYVDPRVFDLYERGIVVEVGSGRGVEGQLVDLLGD